MNNNKEKKSSGIITSLKALSKTATTLALGAFAAYFFYNTIASVAYTLKLHEFYGTKPSLEYPFRFSVNGNGSLGDLINVSDLKAKDVPEDGATIAELCSDVTSNRGFPTLSVVGDLYDQNSEAVCCNISDSDQWLVPYKDDLETGTRHYLCGSWPNLDHVTQLISNGKLEILK